MGPEALTPEAQSVLAVLLLAGIWSSHFESSWVTVDQFGHLALYLGKRVDRESLKAAIRHGITAIQQLPEAPPIESRRTRATDEGGTPLREYDRRLIGPVPTTFQAWLLENGAELLEHSLWNRFLANEFRPISSIEETVAGLEETAVRTLLSTGRHNDAEREARAAIKEAQTERDRRPLEVALATTLLRRG
ncbi:MAG: hypothetical protein QUU85_01265, partial [Candidatus Eisenbacteria bacterium]|nr:hypothetical protein [Candidatus Eisenbacteria bacterium]